MTDVIQFLNNKSIQFRNAFNNLSQKNEFKNWANKIIKNEHPILPLWVKKNNFYQEMRQILLYEILKYINRDLFLKSELDNLSPKLNILKCLSFPIYSHSNQKFLNDQHKYVEIPKNIISIIKLNINYDSKKDIINYNNDKPPVINLIT